MSGMMARAARCSLALSLCAVATGCASTPQDGASVTILVPWDDPTEFMAFQKVIDPWEQEQHVHVTVEPSRALVQELDADLLANDPPDVADLPSPAAVYSYYTENHLKPLPTVGLSSYAQPWRGLAELGKSTAYAVPVKADIKGLIWYNTRVLRSPPTNWAALVNLSRHGTPLCLALASSSTSGWPGADWVADILLSKDHADNYEDWLGGELGWTSADVEDAWNTWGMLMRNGKAVYGGVSRALETNFNDYKKEIASGGCALEHGALSATGLTSTKGYKYIPFPPISGSVSPVLVSGDFMSLFTDNPSAGDLLKYLASTRAQELWVGQPGYAFSADQAVEPASYYSDVQREIAGKYLRPGSSILCFSGEDMMLPDMTTAFEQAILDYVNNQATLPALLKGLQKTQEGVSSSSSSSSLSTHACTKP
jgi:alpha-glucoside transport system substrate-binding protein